MKIIGKDFMEFKHLGFEGWFQNLSPEDVQGKACHLCMELYVCKMTFKAFLPHFFPLLIKKEHLCLWPFLRGVYKTACLI
jgi:hypothetical protein